MYFADYHTHSRVSPDAFSSMTEMAEAAIRQGLQEICFTDHVEPIWFGSTAPRKTVRGAVPKELFEHPQLSVNLSRTSR